MKKDLTEIVFVLDMTGSMQPLTNDCIGGFNSFVDDQKKLPGDANLTLVLFNSFTENKLFNRANIKNVRNINEKDYMANGMTPLLDAVGRSIDDLGKDLDKLAEDQKPEKVIFVIMTDGEENYSKHFSRAQIFDKIKLQQEQYNWNFIYLGANVDSFAEAQGLGIKYDPNIINVHNFAHSGIGTRSAYTSASGSTSSYRASSSKS